MLINRILNITEVCIREIKYIEFLRNTDKLESRAKYFKNVKYRKVEETSDKYILSAKKNISFGKSLEGDLFIIGRIQRII